MLVSDRMTGSQAISFPAPLTKGNWLFNFAIGLFIPPALQNIRYCLLIVFGILCVMAAAKFWLTYPETCDKTLEEIEVLFGDNAPRPWKTRKSHSHLTEEVDAVTRAQAKGEARASIEKVIAADKGMHDATEKTEAV